jgi:hypothetical protein
MKDATTSTPEKDAATCTPLAADLGTTMRNDMVEQTTKEEATRMLETMMEEVQGMQETQQVQHMQQENVEEVQGMQETQPVQQMQQAMKREEVQQMQQTQPVQLMQQAMKREEVHQMRQKVEEDMGELVVANMEYTEDSSTIIIKGEQETTTAESLPTIRLASTGTLRIVGPPFFL